MEFLFPFKAHDRLSIRASFGCWLLPFLSLQDDGPRICHPVMFVTVSLFLPWLALPSLFTRSEAYLSSGDDDKVSLGSGSSSEDDLSRSDEEAEIVVSARGRRDATKSKLERRVSPGRKRGQQRQALAPNRVPDAAESLRLLSEAISGPAPQPSRHGEAQPLNKVATPVDDFHGPWGMGTSVPVYMTGGVDSSKLDKEGKAAIFMEGLAEAAGPGKCPFGFDKLAKEADKVIKKRAEANSPGPEHDG